MNFEEKNIDDSMMQLCGDRNFSHENDDTLKGNFLCSKDTPKQNQGTHDV